VRGKRLADGDLDQDGEFTLEDALFLARVWAGAEVLPWSAHGGTTSCYVKTPCRRRLLVTETSDLLGAALRRVGDTVLRALGGRNGGTARVGTAAGSERSRADHFETVRAEIEGWRRRTPVNRESD